DLGNIGIAHPAWTTTWFKLNRNDISAWQKTPMQEGPGGLAKSGLLGETIGKVEAHILKKVPHLSKSPKELDRYVAQVLAGQTLKINGRKFTIFSDEFAKYRSEMNLAPTSIDPKQADDDFFNAFHNRGSEMILLGKEAFKGILGIQSTGEFFEAVKSGMFLKQLALREEDLKKEFGVDGMEYKTYVKEMSSKMNEWLISNANDSRSATKLGHTKFPAEEDYVLLTYLQKGLINIQTLLKLDTTATSLGPIVIRQMFDSPPPAVSREEVMRIATEYRNQNRMTEAGFKVIQGVCYPGEGVQRPVNRDSDQPSANSPKTQAA
ncbi:hypothetical protein HOL63_04090, partial [Candidatus Peregrinibacteria bacterium]|nr:hypothetical protein [Candidatus Peregrinibacteria bacterium]